MEAEYDVFVFENHHHAAKALIALWLWLFE